MRSRKVSATWVRGVLEALAASGLDVAAACREVGLDHQAILGADAGCPTEKLSALWAVAEARSGNPAIGLVTRGAAQPACFDVVGYAMMSSASLMEALERLQRYLRLLADDHTVALLPQDKVTHAVFQIGDGAQPVPRARYESSFLILLTFCRWMAGRELKPHALELTYPAPHDWRPYEAAFGCPVTFSAASNRLVFTTSDLIAPLPTANPALLGMLDQLAGERLQQLEPERTSSQVCELIRRKLPDGEPVRAMIAQMLHVSERTLQRLLTKEGTSFQQLLDQTRRELAERYLAQPQVSLGETAYLLGFAEQSIFTRACKRWFNVSPGQVRAQLLGC